MVVLVSLIIVLLVEVTGGNVVNSENCNGFTILHGVGLRYSGGPHPVLKNNWTDCCNACSNHSNCTAFTYHPAGTHNDLQCTLFTEKGSGHDSNGTISGYIPQPPSPSPPPTPLPTLPPINHQLHPPLGFQPNIVFIQTDDQDVELGGLEPMPKLRKLVGEQGTTHSKWYVNTPVCCPSRTETLSGRYHHNIRDDNGPEWELNGCGDEPVGDSHPCGCMRVNTSRVFEDHTYSNYLMAAGYHTGYFGKYLNPPAMDMFCHNKSTPVPGWNEFLGMCNTAYYNVTWVNTLGNTVYTGSEPEDYSTAIVGNATIKFIKSAAASNKPFFVSAATRAPHDPQTPAPWYKHALPGTKAKRTPSYNAVGSGHVPWIQNQQPLSSAEENANDIIFANRWRSLLSVDDLVEGIVKTLEDLGLTSKTFIFFTSDHGFHLGQLRLAWGKRHFYEFDARVPMLISGPSISANSTTDFIAGNVDLAPTFVALAGVDVIPTMDGRSVLHMLLNTTTPADPKPWRTMFPIEFSGLAPLRKGRLNDCPNNTYRGLRIYDSTSNKNTMVAEMTTVTDYDYNAPNWHEFYDMESDHYQLTSGWDSLSEAMQTEYLDMIKSTWHCQGSDCP